MKTILLTSLCSTAMLLTALGQDPAAPPPAPTAPALEAGASATPPAPATATSPAARASATPRNEDDEDEDLERRIERKVKRGLSITFGDDKERDERVDRATRRIRRDHDFDVDDGALMAIPIVGIIFTTLFGAPVLIVGVIMFFSFWKARSLHKTVRMMVEKGQPVPEALFATPQTPRRQKSDLRRGIILVMVGIGVMILFGAMDDWDGGAWALGIIPFLIGATYLLFWRLEGHKFTFENTANNHAGTDTPPPLP